MPSTHQPQYIEFVARLRTARRAKKITQKQLGKLLHKPQAFISKVETCERRLDLIEAAKWCVALGTTLEQVLPAELRNAMDQPGGEKRP